MFLRATFLKLFGTCLLLAVCVLQNVALGQGTPPVAREAVSRGYQTRMVEGWRVQVKQELLADQREATEAALLLLQLQLVEILRVVPPKSVQRLREVTLWFSPEYPGITPRAEYHPDVGWLRANRRNPDMAQGVEFTDIRDFEREMKRMPNFVLHELAHAYHDRVLGFEQPDVIAAYEAAKRAGLYDSVERTRGDGSPLTRERAYALTDPKEYFAEGSEAFFSRNDFFPFNRAELHRHDPRLEEVLERLWGRND